MKAQVMGILAVILLVKPVFATPMSEIALHKTSQPTLSGLFSNAITFREINYQDHSNFFQYDLPLASVQSVSSDIYLPAMRTYPFMQPYGLASTLSWSPRNGRQIGSVAPAENETTEPIPEPATMLLFGAGLVGLAGLKSRMRNMSFPWSLKTRQNPKSDIVLSPLFTPHLN